MLRDTFVKFTKLQEEMSDWLDRFHDLFMNSLPKDRGELENCHTAAYLAYMVFNSELRVAERNMVSQEQLDECTERESRFAGENNPNACKVCGGEVDLTNCVDYGGGEVWHNHCAQVERDEQETVHLSEMPPASNE